MAPVHLISKAFFLLLIVQASIMMAKSETQMFSKTFNSLQGAHKGQTINGLNQMKQYLKAFGYYPNNPIHNNFNDYYDDILEFAVKIYQKYYNLQITGKLDDNTIKQMMVPRCGDPDIFKSEDKDRWSKRELTYTFNSSEQVMSIEQMSPIIDRAFKRWTNVSGLIIREVLNSSAQTDMVLGFHRRDHGDEVPFDGPRMILAHAFYPEEGMCHFDAEENWSTIDNPTREQVDFESLAMHEMGHLLGLTHTKDRNAIMYPNYHIGTVKRDLRQEDINRIRALYNVTN